MYALAILPLIHHVNHDIDLQMMPQPLARLPTFAPGGTSLSPLVQHMATTSCLAAKQSHHAAALSAFHDTQITITAEGKPHLGAALGTFTFVEHYVKRKVEGWAQELNQLASIAANNPHAAYAAFTHGRWIFLARAIPNFSHWKTSDSN